MTVLTVSILLLFLRSIAIYYIVRVILTSYPLLKAENDPEVKPLRYVMFSFAIVVLSGNIIPIIVDLYALFSVDIWSSDPGIVLTFYSLSNAASAAVSAIFFWLIYRTAGNSMKLSTSKSDKKRK